MNLRKRRHNIIKIALVLLGLLALTGVQAKEKITYYEHDAFGNIIAATDENGEILWKEHYDPYGNRLTRDQAAGDNHIWYTGHQETDFGLIYMGARHYDPTTGRFLQIDPMGFMPNNPHSFNRYVYANNNPYRYTDPSGNIPIDTIWDAGNVLYDLGKIGYGYAKNDQALIEEGATDLALDAAATMIPYVPAGTQRLVRTSADAIGSAKRAPTRTARRTQGCCCFEKGTPVLTENGLKAIEDVQLGELVWSADTETGDKRLKPVTELFLTQGKPLFELTLATNDNQRETIKVTDNHPFNVIGLGWVDSAKLRPGMKVEGYGETPLTVAAVRETERVEDTYNLEVADFHTFYAGERLALVHNSNCGNCNNPPSRGYDRPSNETKSGSAVKQKDAVDDWDDFLGPNQTNIDPRDGLPDPDRIWSADGKRSVRFGQHEMNSKPNKLHYHKETWYPGKVENELQRIPK